MSGWFMFGQVANAGLNMYFDKDIVTGKSNYTVPVIGKLSQMMRHTAKVAAEVEHLMNAGYALDMLGEESLQKECVDLLGCFFPFLRMIPTDR